MSDADADEGNGELACDRVPTRPIEPLAARITVDVSDPQSCAAFLETIARILRARSRLTVLVE